MQFKLMYREQQVTQTTISERQAQSYSRKQGLRRIIFSMSPTVFRACGFRFYFFSREEPRMHVHVQGHSGEAKLWLHPAIELAQNVGLSRSEISEALRLVQEHENEIRKCLA